MSSAISIEPIKRYAKRKIGFLCRSYNSRKAAWSPSPAFLSKSSSVVVSGNRALDPAGIASYGYYQNLVKSYCWVKISFVGADSNAVSGGVYILFSGSRPVDKLATFR